MKFILLFLLTITSFADENAQLYDILSRLERSSDKLSTIPKSILGTETFREQNRWQKRGICSSRKLCRSYETSDSKYLFNDGEYKVLNGHYKKLKNYAISCLARKNLTMESRLSLQIKSSLLNPAVPMVGLSILDIKGTYVNIDAESENYVQTVLNETMEYFDKEMPEEAKKHITREEVELFTKTFLEELKKDVKQFRESYTKNKFDFPITDLVSNFDYFYLPMEQKAKIDNWLHTEYTKLDEIFNDLKKESVLFLDSKKNKNNVSEIDNLKSKISTLRFKTPLDSTITSLQAVSCKSKNAAYNPVDNSIFICHEFLNSTPEQQKVVLSHEIAHAIDTCVSSLDFMVVDNDKAELAKHPYVNIEGKSTDIPGMSTDDYPFKPLVSCFRQKESVRIRRNTKNEMKNALKIIHGKDYDLSNLFETYRKHRHCNYQLPQPSIWSFANTSLADQSGEAFADWFAVELFARRVKKLSKLERRKLIIKSSEFQLEELCQKDMSDFHLGIKQELIDLNCIVEVKPTRLQRFMSLFVILPPNPHPKTKKRFEKIMMAHPVFKDAFNCLSDTPYCQI